jgi:hypothetical protein
MALSGADKVFYTTGRLTSEMVIKSAQMGVPIVVSRSGITQMGHEVAQRLGLCAIGRAMNRRFVCYAAPSACSCSRSWPDRACAQRPEYHPHTRQGACFAACSRAGRAIRRWGGPAPAERLASAECRGGAWVLSTCAKVAPMNTLHRPSIWALSWRSLWRDLRAGDLRLLIVAVALAVAALTAVGFFADRIKGGLQRDARQLLGGDAVVSSDNPPPAAFQKRRARSA